MARRRSGLVVLGGTFDHFHVGHRAMLSAALEAGERIGVGVTTAEYLRRNPKPVAERLEPYATRKAAVSRYLADHRTRQEVYVGPLNDRWGRSVEPGVSHLIVSPDTRSGARAVNAERRRRGLRPVTVQVIPLVLAADLIGVSSRRIRAGLISPDGHRLPPLRIGLSSDRRPDARATAESFRRWVPGVRLRVDWVSPEPSVRNSASSRSVSGLARARANRALQRNDLGVGVARRLGRDSRLAVAIRDGSGFWTAPRASTLPAGSVEKFLDVWLGARSRARSERGSEVVYRPPRSRN